MKSKIITANKDRGTSVGFSEKWNDDVKDIGEKLKIKECKEHEIVEGNKLIKLIAEFICTNYRGNDESLWISDVPNRMEFVINESEWSIDAGYHCFRPDKDWSDLMPVVEKIQSIDITPPPNYQGYRIEIVVQGYVKITGAYMPQIFTNVSIEGSLIKAIWKAVTIFIVWYNQNKNNERHSM